MTNAQGCTFFNLKSITVISIFVFYDPDLVVNLFVEGLFKDE